MTRLRANLDLKELSLRTATRARLGAAFVVVAVLPLIALGWLSVNRQREVAIENTFRTLEGIVSAQQGHLESMISADQELADLLSSNESLRNALSDQEGGAVLNPSTVESTLTDALASSDRLLNICLHGRDGDVIAATSTNAAERYKAAGLAIPDSTVHSYIIAGADGGPVAVTNTAVIVDGEVVGSITVETDATSITELTTTLNDTGETSVAQRTPDGSQLIAPLRFRDDAVLNLTIPSSNAGAPITMATQGIEGRFGDAIDYRGMPVIAVTRHIDQTGWGLVAKIDRAEVLGDLDDFERLILITLCISTLAIILISIAVTRAVWRPVSELTAVAVAVASGDHSRRAPVRRHDELGVLAHAVNTMTDGLTTAAEADGERRRELEVVNTRLLTREEELRSIFENAVDGIVSTDSSGRITDVNRAAQELFGLDRDDAIGIPAFTLLTAEGMAPSKLFVEAAAAGAAGVEMIALNRSGQQLPVLVAVNEITVADKTSYTAVVRNISERRAFEQRLSYEATHDALTGLSNRAHFRTMLEAALARAANSDFTVGVLFIDLDRFKVVNDSRGHAAGDQLLIAVAQRLQKSVREGDMVARFGGDEFVILCPVLRNATEAERLANRIHSTLAERFTLDGDDEHIACSVGIAISGGGTEPDALISDADVAMYRAKSDRREDTVLFDADMRLWVESRHEMETALRNAIESDAVDVHYQPIVHLQTGEIHSAEVLARWDRIGHGRVHPSEFIAVAEETGLIVALGRSLFRRVCEQQVLWTQQTGGNPTHLSINMSSKELSQPDCFDVIARIIAETGANASFISLELTESALAVDPEAATSVLTRLRQMGFTVTIDDFGTGYSSLTYLQRFPIDAVKIDRSLMDELVQESLGASIISLVLGVGERLGIKVIAEGVESEQQLGALRDLGCAYAQGYLFARPQSAASIATLLWPQFSEADFGPQAADHIGF